MSMSLRGAVVYHFKSILQEKCPGIKEANKHCLDAAWQDIDARCMFHMFTVILGYVLIVTVSIGQLPLLFKILQWRSGKTYVSPTRVCLCVFIASSNVIYAVHKDFPISIWGESVILLTQYVIITNLMFVYHNRHRNAIGFMLLYIPVMVVLMYSPLSPRLINALKLMNLPLTAITKVPYIYKSLKQKSNLQQYSSYKSLILLNLGSSGRLLTSTVDTKDHLMILGYAVECVLDYVLTSQALHYKRKQRRESLKHSVDVDVTSKLGEGKKKQRKRFLGLW